MDKIEMFCIYSALLIIVIFIPTLYYSLVYINNYFQDLNKLIDDKKQA